MLNGTTPEIQHKKWGPVVDVTVDVVTVDVVTVTDFTVEAISFEDCVVDVDNFLLCWNNVEFVFGSDPISGTEKGRKWRTLEHFCFVEPCITVWGT